VHAGVRAQAWVPPSGEGSISFSYQRIDNTGHRRTNGFLVPHGLSLDMSLYVEAEYAFTSRFSLTAGMPYVFAKYTDPNPPAFPIPYLPVDQCHCWHSGWQDFGVTARYNLAGGTGGAFALTPSVSIGAPSHDYNFRGESALGRDLREVRIGVDAGRRLDASPLQQCGLHCIRQRPSIIISRTKPIRLAAYFGRLRRYRSPVTLLPYEHIGPNIISAGATAQMGFVH
jgi:hypothetical protein